MKTLLLLDFDRAIFDLHSFLVDVQKYVWELPPGDVSTVRVEEDILDIFDRPEAYPSEAHATLKRASKLLPRRNYLFEDVGRLLKRLPKEVEPAVITFGREDRQQFKQRFAPPIKKLPFFITEDNKGLLLAEAVQLKGQKIQVRLPNLSRSFDKVILIDDNPVSFLPLVERGTPVTMVHLARVGERFSEESVPPNVRRIASLDEFEPGITE